MLILTRKVNQGIIIDAIGRIWPLGALKAFRRLLDYSVVRKMFLFQPIRLLLWLSLTGCLPDRIAVMTPLGQNPAKKSWRVSMEKLA
jgi:hypothetical protein